MLKLLERGNTEQVKHHRERIYTGGLGEHHRERVYRIRCLCSVALNLLGKETFVVELGIGPGYIGGWFASRVFSVLGYEIHADSARKCRAEYPAATVLERDFLSDVPMRCGLLIMTEVLEHVPDPEGLARAWMEKADWAVISSPLEGDFPVDNSGKDHQWSFSADDFLNFGSLGGHAVENAEDVPAGAHNIRILLTRRVRQEAI